MTVETTVPAGSLKSGDTYLAESGQTDLFKLQPTDGTNVPPGSGLYADLSTGLLYVVPDATLVPKTSRKVVPA